MEITNTVTIATENVFSPMESMKMLEIFEDKFGSFMNKYPDVYAGTSFIKAENGLRYIFIIPSDNADAIDASERLVATLDAFYFTFHFAFEA